MSLIRRGRVGTPSASTVTMPVGVAVLHLFCRLRPDFDPAALSEAVASAADAEVQVVTFAVVGHKADAGAMLLGGDVWALRRAQAAIAASGLAIVDSYLSITEISEYAGSLPESSKRHRLYPHLPPESAGVIGFYPMSKRRTATDNWYSLEFEERSRLMHDHGRHGRRHAGKVLQLVTASTGLDDWEWGVTLFAAEPSALKDVVYELRYDEASARYAEFGPFIVGLLCPPEDLASLAGAAGE